MSFFWNATPRNSCLLFFFFSSRRRHTRFDCDWSSDVCSSDLYYGERENLARSPAGREKLALQLLLLIGRNFHQGLSPMSITELANRLQLPAALVKASLDMFQRSRLVLPLADEETFVLGRAAAKIRIKGILDGVRTAGCSA